MINKFTKEDLEEALPTLASMINRIEKAKKKFASGGPQYSLQKNRLNALTIVSSLILKELGESILQVYSREELVKALPPTASLISKSEKARNKLAQDTWQHTMLTNNLKALYLASQLLTEELNEIKN
jgi:hypothetical protein